MVSITLDLWTSMCGVLFFFCGYRSQQSPDWWPSTVINSPTSPSAISVTSALLNMLVASSLHTKINPAGVHKFLAARWR